VTDPTETPPPTLQEALRARLGGRAGIEAGPRPLDVTVHLARAEDVSEAVSELCARGLTLATVVATDEQETDARDLKVRYVFEPGVGQASPLPDTFVTLCVPVDPARPVVPSISVVVPAANWHEREAHDLFGIVFEGHPDPRPLVVHDGWPEGAYPLRKAFDGSQRLAVEPAEEFPHLVAEGEGVLEVPVGPIHAGIIEPGHFRFSTFGESVLHLEPRLFYTHRGLEKRAEGMPVHDALLVAERLCGVCSVSHALGFCEAVEQIAGVEVPGRARVIRTIALELERLYNHVGDIGNIGAGASYHYGASVGARMKEALQQVGELCTGHRFLRGLVTPGGVQADLGSDLAHAIEQAIGSTATELESLAARIEDNPSFVDRLDDIGILPRQAAIDLGVTGVGARASGIDRDARRDHPHAAYASVSAPEVRVQTEADGDVHARLSVRVAEARESMRLCKVLLASLPSGPHLTRVPELLPPGRVGLSAVESPRGATVCWLRTDSAGRVDRYHVRSASFANWPAVPIAALSALIPDFPLVNKSFELCYACTDR